MLRNTLATLLALPLLVACAHAPTSGTDFHDPAAKESAARVLKKDIVRGTIRLAGPSVPGTYVPVTMPSDATVFMNAAALPQRSGTIDVYEYRVRTSDGREVVVYSEQFSLEVGGCVIVQESRKASYPRIQRAPAGSCR